MARKTTGIRTRHSRGCRSRDGGACSCAPSYEAWTWSVRDGKKIRKTFPTLAAAKSWRADASVAIRKGAMRAPTSTTLRQAWETWLEGAKDGSIRTRSGDTYKPAAIRGYSSSMRLRVLDDLGATKLSELSRVEIQDLADRLLAQGLDASTIRNTLMPLRAIFRRAVARGELAVNPTTAIELPAVRGKRDRIASAAEAASLIAAVPEGDRALWAAAFYSGLRRGELRALRLEDVDLQAGVIRVERSWDDKDGAIDPKSKAGRRHVPIVAELRSHLLAHRLRSGRAAGFVFGRSASDPFSPALVRRRARKAWADAELAAIGLHEARHTFASLLIAAGVNVKAISNYMGHASITITLDRYGHLMPGHEAEAIEKLDAYLSREQETG